MKYFDNEDITDKKDDFFVKKYEIKDDKIEVFRGNDSVIMDYSKDKVDLLNDIMKNQIVNISFDKERQNKYKKNREIFWIIYNLYFTGFTYSRLNSSDTKLFKYIFGIATIIFIELTNIRIKLYFKYKDKIKEVEKFKYFIENEDIINYELIKRYLESFNTNNSCDFSPITINDIDDMSLKELKEIKELIENNYTKDDVELVLSKYRKVKGTY